MKTTATAFMRVKHVKITHVLLPHIARSIAGKRGPLVTIKVHFSENGESYGATVRMEGDTLGFCSFETGTFTQNMLLLDEEVSQYLVQACKEAGRIAQPLVSTH